MTFEEFQATRQPCPIKEAPQDLQEMLDPKTVFVFVYDHPVDLGYIEMTGTGIFVCDWGDEHQIFSSPNLQAAEHFLWQKLEQEAARHA